DEVAVALAQPPGDDRPGVLRDLDPLTLADAALLRDAPIRLRGGRGRWRGHGLASPVAPEDPVQATDCNDDHGRAEDRAEDRGLDRESNRGRDVRLLRRRLEVDRV